jgi:hypothetical protein
VISMATVAMSGVPTVRFVRFASSMVLTFMPMALVIGIGRLARLGWGLSHYWSLFHAGGPKSK